MSKATILTLVSDMSLAQSNATEVSIIYDEVIRELGFVEVLTSTELIAVTGGTSTYALAPLNIRGLEFYLSTGFLTMSDGRGLGALFGSDWRNRTGAPVAYTYDDETSGDFRLVPAPVSDDILTVIRTDARQDIPTWLDLPVTFEILAREYLRESDHQDIELATLCKAMADLLFNMVGVEKNGKTV